MTCQLEDLVNVVEIVSSWRLYHCGDSIITGTLSVTPIDVEPLSLRGLCQRRGSIVVEILSTWRPLLWRIYFYGDSITPYRHGGSITVEILSLWGLKVEPLSTWRLHQRRDSIVVEILSTWRLSLWTIFYYRLHQPLSTWRLHHFGYSVNVETLPLWRL